MKLSKELVVAQMQQYNLHRGILAAGYKGKT